MRSAVKHTEGASDADADQLRETLRKHLEIRGLSINAWTQKAGITESTLRNFLAGRSETVTYATLTALAHASGIKAGDFLRHRNLLSSNVKIMYETNAKEWSPIGSSHLESELDLPHDKRHPNVERFGVIVGDNSFDTYYKEGSILICAKYKELKRKVAVNDKVLCEESKVDETQNIRQNDAFQLERHSIREIVEAEGALWVALRSKSPRWQQPIRVPKIARYDSEKYEPYFLIDEGKRMVELLGVVIGAYIVE